MIWSNIHYSQVNNHLKVSLCSSLLSGRLFFKAKNCTAIVSEAQPTLNYPRTFYLSYIQTVWQMQRDGVASLGELGVLGEKTCSWPNRLISSYFTILNLLICAASRMKEALWAGCSTSEKVVLWTCIQAANLCLQSHAERPFFCRSPSKQVQSWSKTSGFKWDLSYFLCLTCITSLGIHIIWAFLYFISPDSIELATENSCIAGSSYTNQPRTLIPSMFANLCMTYLCSGCFPFSGLASAVLLGRVSV